MALNPRTKGASAEREIYSKLNLLVIDAFRAHGIEPRDIPDNYLFERNQNQSSGGGSDLTNPYGLAIEIKRQESLAITTWWKQCATSARKENKLPVLLYRKNHQAWKCVILASLFVPNYAQIVVPSEISWDDFCVWAKAWLYARLKQDLKRPSDETGTEQVVR